MLHIDSYKFGEIVIGGKVYNSDLIIIGNNVYPDWWRKQGHLLQPEDLMLILEAEPVILIVGCGAQGIMRISEQVKHTLIDNHIELVALNTSDAVSMFNELNHKDSNISAAFHLTC